VSRWPLMIVVPWVLPGRALASAQPGPKASGRPLKAKLERLVGRYGRQVQDLSG